MKPDLCFQLERMKIADALICGEWRVEYVQTSEVDACYIVMRAADVMMLTGGNRECHRKQITGFLARAAPDAGRFDYEPSGSISRLWDENIAVLEQSSRACWFVSGSPFTGVRRTQFRRPRRKNEWPVLDGAGKISAVWSHAYRGTDVRDAVLFAVGSVYSLKENRSNDRLAYLRVTDIRAEKLGQISHDDIYEEGYTLQEQFEIGWMERQRFFYKTPVWVVSVVLVAERETLPPLCCAPLPAPALPTFRQLSFLPLIDDPLYQIGGLEATS